MRAEDIDLSAMLRFRPDEGLLLLGDNRMVLFSRSAMETLRGLVVGHVGHQLAAAIFSQFGYRCGQDDYRSVALAGDWDSEIDRISSGPVTHMWEGIVHVTPEALDYDRASGHFFMTGRWRNSYEAEVHLASFGQSTEPVCWSLTGYASGWASAFFGAPTIAIETACVGRGEDFCRFEIRADAEWDERARPWRQALTADSMTVTGAMEQMVASRTRELTEMNEHLAQARDAADRAAAVKSSFLARASHELRTPINGVLGVAELLRTTPLNDDQQHLVDLLVAAASQQTAIVSDILDYSSLESGGSTAQMAPVNLEEVLDEVAGVCAPMAADAGVQFTVAALPQNPSASLISEAIKIRQIITALTSNAIKFTAPGGMVDVAVATRNDTVAISVTDTGVGIPETQIAEIFEPFEQADGSITREFGGTGLGLALCRELAEVIGGAITVVSQPGIGSTFSLVLPRDSVGRPAGHAPEQLETGAQARPWVPVRALVAEDNHVNAVVVTRVLESLGASVELAVDGDEAIDRYEAAGPFDVVISDLHMPRRNGFDVAAHIRKREAECSRPAALLVALTADVTAEARRRAADVGFSIFLTKPLRRQTLSGLVARARSAQALGAPADNGSTPSATTPG